jgi:hypothetical protein
MPGRDTFAEKWEADTANEKPGSTRILEDMQKKELKSKLKGLTADEQQEFIRLNAELESETEVTTPEGLDNDPRTKRLKELLKLAKERQSH